MIVSKVSYRLLGERHASDKLAKANELSTRILTAKSVKEEIDALAASCAKITRRMATCHDPRQLAKLKDLLARQEAIGRYMVDQALNGRVLLNRPKAELTPSERRAKDTANKAQALKDYYAKA